MVYTTSNSSKTVLDFIKELKEYGTATKVIENIDSKSKQGYIYELLWDLCIKLNIFMKIVIIKML